MQYYFKQHTAVQNNHTDTNLDHENTDNLLQEMVFSCYLSACVDMQYQGLAGLIERTILANAGTAGMTQVNVYTVIWYNITLTYVTSCD